MGLEPKPKAYKVEQTIWTGSALLVHGSKHAVSKVGFHCKTGGKHHCKSYTFEKPIKANNNFVFIIAWVKVISYAFSYDYNKQKKANIWTDF